MSALRLLPGKAILPAFFLAKILCALILLKLSSERLSVGGFALFSQLFLFSALVNMIAVGGSQNGIIRFAAIADTADDVARTRNGAFILWAAAAGLIGLPLVLASPLVADLLTGRPALWPMTVAIALLNFAGGAGQVWCSLLTGRGKVPASISAQFTGLIAGTAFAVAFLMRGDPLLAAIGYSIGPLVMTLAAALPLRRLALPKLAFAKSRARATELLRFSGAFLTLAVVTPSALFAMRGFYQDLFGMEALGYWLTASRISDTTTQLLALFLVQYFLPSLAKMPPGSAPSRRLTVHTCLLGAAVMASAPAVFALAPEFFVATFLAEKYLPAIPMILLYLVGDIARVWSAVAMQATFARGNLRRYVAIELATIAAMGGILVTLALMGNVNAPVIAYPIAYGLAALVLTVAFFARQLTFFRERAAPPS